MGVLTYRCFSRLQCRSNAFGMYPGVTSCKATRGVHGSLLYLVSWLSMADHLVDSFKPTYVLYTVCDICM